jgi:hypothetical protein
MFHIHAIETFNCCDGFYARIINDQRSAIDYVLMSKGLSTNVSSVLIDEKGVFDLNSDHVFRSGIYDVLPRLPYIINIIRNVSPIILEIIF